MKRWWRALPLKWKLSSYIALVVLCTILLYTVCFWLLIPIHLRQLITLLGIGFLILAVVWPERIFLPVRLSNG